MPAATLLSAPAGAWTAHDPTGPVSVRIQNLSTSVPIRIAISATEPNANSGYAVMAPDSLGLALAEEFNVGEGEKVWIRPHDHSGLTAQVSIMPVADISEPEGGGGGGG